MPDAAMPRDLPPYEPPAPLEDNLPQRIVVGANGAYWREFDGFYSMPVVSDDNDPVEIVAVYERVPFDPNVKMGTARPSAQAVAQYHRELEAMEAATREPGTIS